MYQFDVWDNPYGKNSTFMLMANQNLTVMNRIINEGANISSGNLELDGYRFFPHLPMYTINVVVK